MSEASRASSGTIPSARQRFLAMLGEDAYDDLLPTRLATAAAQVLRIDGAGLSLMSARIRVPLGASNDDAAAAERLQVTVGEGPCLQALHDRREVRVGSQDIARRWPIFYDELTRRTPYRSIVSLPLHITASLDGAVDLYFRSPTAAFSIDLDVAAAIADEMSEQLRHAASPAVESVHTAGQMVPAWTYSPAARGRMRTWIAVGVLMTALQLPGTDALDRLRAYTYSHEQDLNDTTNAIINGTIAVDDFTR